MTRILKYTPIIGQQYNDWTVIDEQIYKVNSNRASYWKVRCKCGTEGLRNAAHLVNDKVSSCKKCAALKLSFENSYLNKVKRRAQKMNFEFNLTLDYVLSLYKGKCELSGLNISFGRHWNKLSEQTASLDRIDSTKGYIEGNVQWVHKDVNMMKGSLNEERFIELCQLISSSKCG